MVKAKIIVENSKIVSFNVKGHANSGEYGQDLVCAAITGIVIGALNALDLKFKYNVDLSVKENEIDIKVLKNDDLLNHLLEFMVIQLESIEIQYKKNFKIERMI